MSFEDDINRVPDYAPGEIVIGYIPEWMTATFIDEPEHTKIKAGKLYICKAIIPVKDSVYIPLIGKWLTQVEGFLYPHNNVGHKHYLFRKYHPPKIEQKGTVKKSVPV